jgi:hypothetical protein
VSIGWGEDAEDLLTGLDSAGQEASLDELTTKQVRALSIRGVEGDGHLISGPPLPVSEELAQLAKKRYYQILDDEIRGLALDALKVYHDIIHDTTGEVDWRLKKNTADSVLDRALGKSPEKVQLTIQSAPWQKLLAGIVFDDELFDANQDVFDRSRAIAREKALCDHKDWSGNPCNRERIPDSTMCKQHSRVWQNGESPNYPGNGDNVVDGTIVD